MVIYSTFYLTKSTLRVFTGMNFSDFFIFIARMSLANVFNLYSLARNSDLDLPKWGCPRISNHLAFNLASVRKISLLMKSEGVLAGNYGILDLRVTLEDLRFRQLCISLGRMYEINDEDRNVTHTLMIDIDKYGTQISTPEDLVRFLDYVIERFGISCIEGNVMLPAGD